MADLDSAIRWVTAHSAEYRVDARKIAIIGESAGGYLVNYAGTHETPETKIAAVVDFYGPVEYGTLALARRDHPGAVSYTHLLSEDSALLSRLFQYRFAAGRGLKGHSFGNLFLTALTDIMGDFPEAVRVSCEVLKIAGRIYPSTAANVALEATLADGAKVTGETRISRCLLYTSRCV